MMLFYLRHYVAVLYLLLIHSVHAQKTCVANATVSTSSTCAFPGGTLGYFYDYLALNAGSKSGVVAIARAIATDTNSQYTGSAAVCAAWCQTYSTCRSSFWADPTKFLSTLYPACVLSSLSIAQNSVITTLFDLPIAGYYYPLTTLPFPGIYLASDRYCFNCQTACTSTAVSVDGCYSDGILTPYLSGPELAAENMTPEVCSSYCSTKSTEYYAVGGVLTGLNILGGVCYCGNALSSLSQKVSSSACNYRCPGASTNSAISCGGISVASLLSLTSYINVFTGPKQPTFISGGCYTDVNNALAPALIKSTYTAVSSVAACKTHCDSYNIEYSLYGLEFGAACYCGYYLLGGSVPAPSTSCSLDCSGGKSLGGCGGSFGFINIYGSITQPPTANPAAIAAASSACLSSATYPVSTGIIYTYTTITTGYETIPVTLPVGTGSIVTVIKGVTLTPPAASSPLSSPTGVNVPITPGTTTPLLTSLIPSTLIPTVSPSGILVIGPASSSASSSTKSSSSSSNSSRSRTRTSSVNSSSGSSTTSSINSSSDSSSQSRILSRSRTSTSSTSRSTSSTSTGSSSSRSRGRSSSRSSSSGITATITGSSSSGSRSRTRSRSSTVNPQVLPTVTTTTYVDPDLSPSGFTTTSTSYGTGAADSLPIQVVVVVGITEAIVYTTIYLDPSLSQSGYTSTSTLYGSSSGAGTSVPTKQIIIGIPNALVTSTITIDRASTTAGFTSTRTIYGSGTNFLAPTIEILIGVFSSSSLPGSTSPPITSILSMSSFGSISTQSPSSISRTVLNSDTLTTSSKTTSVTPTSRSRSSSRVRSSSSPSSSSKLAPSPISGSSSTSSTTSIPGLATSFSSFQSSSTRPQSSTNSIVSPSKASSSTQDLATRSSRSTASSRRSSSSAGNDPFTTSTFGSSLVPSGKTFTSYVYLTSGASEYTSFTTLPLGTGLPSVVEIIGEVLATRTITSYLVPGSQEYGSTTTLFPAATATELGLRATVYVYIGITLTFKTTTTSLGPGSPAFTRSFTLSNTITGSAIGSGPTVLFVIGEAFSSGSISTRTFTLSAPQSDSSLSDRVLSTSTYYYDPRNSGASAYTSTRTILASASFLASTYVEVAAAEGLTTTTLYIPSSATPYTSSYTETVDGRQTLVIVDGVVSTAAAANPTSYQLSTSTIYFDPRNSGVAAYTSTIVAIASESSLPSSYVLIGVPKAVYTSTRFIGASESLYTSTSTDRSSGGVPTLVIVINTPSPATTLPIITTFLDPRSSGVSGYTSTRTTTALGSTITYEEIGLVEAWITSTVFIDATASAFTRTLTVTNNGIPSLIVEVGSPSTINNPGLVTSRSTVYYNPANTALSAYTSTITGTCSGMPVTYLEIATAASVTTQTKYIAATAVIYTTTYTSAVGGSSILVIEVGTPSTTTKPDQITSRSTVYYDPGSTNLYPYTSTRTVTISGAAVTYLEIATTDPVITRTIDMGSNDPAYTSTITVYSSGVPGLIIEIGVPSQPPVGPSTVYVTSFSTILSCASTVTDCPVGSVSTVISASTIATSLAASSPLLYYGNSTTVQVSSKPTPPLVSPTLSEPSPSQTASITSSFSLSSSIPFPTETGRPICPSANGAFESGKDGKIFQISCSTTFVGTEIGSGITTSLSLVINICDTTINCVAVSFAGTENGRESSYILYSSVSAVIPTSGVIGIRIISGSPPPSFTGPYTTITSGTALVPVTLKPTGTYLVGTVIVRSTQTTFTGPFTGPFTTVTSGVATVPTTLVPSGTDDIGTVIIGSTLSAFTGPYTTLTSGTATVPVTLPPSGTGRTGTVIVGSTVPPFTETFTTLTSGTATVPTTLLPSGTGETGTIIIGSTLPAFTGPYTTLTSGTATVPLTLPLSGAGEIGTVNVGSGSPSDAPGASTVYTTRISTILSCAPTITDCPYGSVTTEITPIYTEPTSSLVSLTLSTVSSTKISTITACGYFNWNCQIGAVTTETISLYTTYCPVSASRTSASTPATAPIVTFVSQSTSTATVTVMYTISTCAPLVTDCPYGKTMSTIYESTTVCPVTLTRTPGYTAPAPGTSTEQPEQPVLAPISAPELPTDTVPATLTIQTTNTITKSILQVTQTPPQYAKVPSSATPSTGISSYTPSSPSGVPLVVYQGIASQASAVVGVLIGLIGFTLALIL